MKNTTSFNNNSKQLLTIFLFGLSILLFAKVWNGKQEVDTSDRDQAYTERIDRLNNAEQYALLAKTTRYYPCSHCPKGKFFLNKNEIWKYGVTINGQSKRYTDEYLQSINVVYSIEYEGTLQECLEEEAKKIILYYQLPENVVRFDKSRLLRPPGNSKDE